MWLAILGRTKEGQAMTDAGIGMIKMFEDLRLYWYLDSAGKPTIGWGHLILPGETFHGPITNREAEDLLQADIFKHERGLRTLLTVELQPCQMDALISFVFNAGVEAFKDSTMRKKLNDGAPAGEVADEFPRWIYADHKKSRGLQRRRNTEAACFLGAGPGLISAIWSYGA